MLLLQHLNSILEVVQGIGGGAILSLSAIVVSDLVSLKEKGAYNGLIGM
jgi:MFS family permease